eukprot:860012-Pelagomonas_calceolata.AAC.1
MSRDTLELTAGHLRARHRMSSCPHSLTSSCTSWNTKCCAASRLCARESVGKAWHTCFWGVDRLERAEREGRGSLWGASSKLGYDCMQSCERGMGLEVLQREAGLQSRGAQRLLLHSQECLDACTNVEQSDAAHEAANSPCVSFWPMEAAWWCHPLQNWSGSLPKRIFSCLRAK